VWQRKVYRTCLSLTAEGTSQNSAAEELLNRVRGHLGFILALASIHEISLSGVIPLPSASLDPRMASAEASAPGVPSRPPPEIAEDLVRFLNSAWTPYHAVGEPRCPGSWNRCTRRRRPPCTPCRFQHWP